MKKVISFSLWGDNPKYMIGAIKNADLATIYYPDWICRFYIAENVPTHIIQELIARDTTSAAHFNHKRGFFKVGSAWFWNDGQLSGPERNNYHGARWCSRKLFGAARGYETVGSGEDLVFEDLLERQFPGSTSAYGIRPEEVYYIYRWGGTGSYHMRQFGYHRPGGNIGHHEVGAHIQRRAAAGEMLRGHIRLTPKWKQDYQQLVSDHLRSLFENRSISQ